MPIPKIPLTDKDIAKIIELRRRGVPIKYIADQFKRTRGNISQILLAHDQEKGKRASITKW